MKLSLLLGISLATVASTASPLQAQASGQYSLSSAGVTAGGGSPGAGRYRLQGAVGRHDAGSLKGGAYALEGGLFHGLTIQQSPGAPRLKIRLIAGGQAVLSWPKDAAGWLLEGTSAVGSSQWAAVLSPVANTIDEHTVTVPAIGVIKCYRLRKP